MTVYFVCLLSLLFLVLCVQERLCELVRLMGGRVSADFTRHVSRADTHTCKLPVVKLFAYLCILLTCAGDTSDCRPSWQYQVQGEPLLVQ